LDNAVEKDKKNVSEFQADLLKAKIGEIFPFACLICYIASAIRIFRFHNKDFVYTQWLKTYLLKDSITQRLKTNYSHTFNSVAPPKSGGISFRQSIDLRKSTSAADIIN
jgi:hypothetical protein